MTITPKMTTQNRLHRNIVCKAIRKVNSRFKIVGSFSKLFFVTYPSFCQTDIYIALARFEYSWKTSCQLLQQHQSTLVWDRNSVSVTVSAESIGIGIGIGAEIIFAETETLFFFKSDWFLLQILPTFSSGGIKVFISLNINLALQK